MINIVKQIKHIREKYFPFTNLHTQVSRWGSKQVSKGKDLASILILGANIFVG